MGRIRTCSMRSVVDLAELPNVFLGGYPHIDQEVLNPVPVVTVQLQVVSFILLSLLAFGCLLLLDGATALQFLG